MGASITLAGESLISQKQAARQTVDVSRFILAKVPGLDTTLPVDRAAGVPDANLIVHTTPVTREGYLATNKVVYSLMLGTDVGDFDFNWMGLVTAEGVLLIAAYVPLQQKRREIPPLQAGNNLTRNIVWEYDGAQSLSGITVPASTWQFDFTADFTAINTQLAELKTELAKKVDLETWTPPAAVSLDGPVLVYPGSTNTYKITDYNRFSVFTASTTLGTVSVAADVVTLVIPTVAAAGLLTLEVLRDGNKASFRLPVGAAAIVPPSITSPANLATGVILDPLLITTAFEVYPTGFDHHVSTHWQISTNEEFTQLVLDVTSTTELESLRPGDHNVTLAPGKRHYARAFHNGASLQSAAPVATIFNTASTYIRRPAILFPTDGQQDVSSSLTILSDPFSVYGGSDVHLQSRFQVFLSPDGTGLVHDSGWVSTNLTSFKPATALATRIQVYTRVKYKGETLGETEWSPVIAFKTAGELAGTYAKLNGGATTRTAHSAVAIDGNMFVFGGYGSSSNVLGDLWKYNQAGNSWSQLASATVARYCHSAVEIGGKMYVFGGYNGGVLRTLQVYDPVKNTWSQLADGPDARYNHSAVVIDGKMYVYGGSSASSNQVGTGTLWVYNPVSNTWATLTASANRFNHTAVAISGKMYVFGGVAGGNYLRDLWVYTPSTNSWAQLTSATGPRSSHTAVALFGKMYVFGGDSGGADSRYRDLQVFEPDTSTWKQLTPAADVRTDHSAVAIGNSIYVFAGANVSAYLNDLWSIS